VEQQQQHSLACRKGWQQQRVRVTCQQQQLLAPMLLWQLLLRLLLAGAL
jgi:hypothetical protein